MISFLSFRFRLVLALSIHWTFACWTPVASASEPHVRILTPKNESRVVQEQNTILVTGKVSAQATYKPDVDILFVLDVSGSTSYYAGVDFGDSDLKIPSTSMGTGSSQIGVYGGGFGLGPPPLRDLRNSILVAEILAARRLLSQLNSETTRVGLVTFSEDARLLQPLTHEFELVRNSLEDILLTGPRGGTNMVAGIRMAIKELTGLGRSTKRANAVKAQFLLTDGFPTLPIGGGRSPHPEDARLAVNAGRIAGRAGMKIHVFALGEEALSSPRAAVGVARQSGGIFTPVVRPADILAVLESISLVGVEYVEVYNKTTGERAARLRLAPDGFFSSAIPVVLGRNEIQVVARSGSGALGRDSVAVNYEPGGNRSLDLEVFLEKERSLDLEVERLGKSRQEIQREIDRRRESTLGQSP